jgi:hypothetical protein
MTTLQDFQIASFEKKCDFVTSNSNYITLRKLGDSKIYLYHSGEFFIEVYYSSKYKKVLMMNGFNDTAGLEPYAENISLADLGF